MIPVEKKRSWRYLPHGEIEEVMPGIWHVQGTLPGSNPLPRTMVLWTLPSGGLAIHSAVNLSPEAMEQMEALGSPEILIVPNRFHRMDAEAWKERYPELQVIAPAASLVHVHKVIQTDATCEDTLPALGVECISPGGLKPMELIYRVPSTDGHVLIFTDTFFNLPEHYAGFMGFVLRYITGSTGVLGLSRLGRLLGLKNGSDYAEWLRTQKGAELGALIPGHGAPVFGSEACTEALEHAAARL